jgi:His-Xaa-Ser system radical SAM maturase HxsC
MIPLLTKGKSNNILSPIVGRLKMNMRDKFSFIIESNSIDQSVILTKKSLSDIHITGVFNVDINHLTPGDIVVVMPNGIVRTLFRVRSDNNTIFMTNTCNQNCIMCCQPSQKLNDIELLFSINYSLIELIPVTTKQIGITGGEPTLYGKYLLQILTKIFSRIPLINVFVLTNAALLSDLNYFQNFKDLPKDQILFSIPLYGDNSYTHDSIVRTKGAFDKTIKGIYNLFKNNYRVELRIIPQKKNVLRLDKLSLFIYKNLTFVENVAFMGIEYIGKAEKNFDEIWLTPEELNNPLKNATNFLKMSGINCSLYNFQICTLPEELRHLSQSTISDWKREYIFECFKCIEKNRCGGVFYSSISLMKQYLKPLTQ